jgi:creatinine amidohydrolase
VNHIAVSILRRVVVGAATVALLAGMTTATFAADQSLRLEDLTWTELAAAIRAGDTTILLPIGGTEQSGPAIALGKHNVRAEALALKIADKLGNALVAPVMAYVPEGDAKAPSGHLAFPGTITVPDAAFETIVEYAARSFKLHGFRNIVLLGDHGGYQADLKVVADRLNKEWTATPVRVLFIPEYYAVTQGEFVDVLKSRGFSSDEIGTHAGLNDTALMLAIDPALVRADRIQGAKMTAAEGVYGDPRRATAEVGSLGVELIVTRTVAAIQAAARR